MVSNTNIFEKTRYDKGFSDQIMLKTSKDPFPTLTLKAEIIPIIQVTELLFGFPVTVLLFQNWCRRKKSIDFPRAGNRFGMGHG